MTHFSSRLALDMYRIPCTVLWLVYSSISAHEDLATVATRPTDNCTADGDILGKKFRRTVFHLWFLTSVSSFANIAFFSNNPALAVSSIEKYVIYCVSSNP